MSAPTEKPPSSNVQRWQVAGVCVALATITFAVFGQTLTHDFINFDDAGDVYENPVVSRGLTLKGIVWAFSFHSSNWFPLTWLSHMLDCQLYGLNPAGHHFTNVLFHIATVIGLFLVLRQMTGALWRSAFVAAVFAIHPLRVESVAWIAERKDVLSGLFFILIIGAYVRYVGLLSSANPNHNPNLNLLSRPYLLVLLLFALGLMCKPMLVTLPVVLLLLDYWPLRRQESAGKLVLEKLPLLALSAASCVSTVLAQHEAIQSIKSYSLPLRFANALAACLVYLGQMVWPTGLAVLYPYPLNGPPAWEVALTGAALAGISAVALGLRRKQPWLLMGWVWYLVMLLPVVGIIQVGDQPHADRYTYLPQIGIYVALTWLVAEWRMNRMVLGGLMAGVVAVLMVCAREQTAYWQNSETLWTHAVNCTTGNSVAFLNLGGALFKEGKVDEAIVAYQKGVQIAPDDAGLQNSLGDALLHIGKVDDAITHLQRALQIKPDDAGACVNLGNAFLRKGRVDDAIAQYKKALQINPAFALAHNNLGTIFLQKGGVDEAVAEYQKALQISPDEAEFHNNLGKALLQKGSVNEAISQFQKALQLKPDFAEAQFNLGNALLRTGRPDDALAHYQAAAQIKPDYMEAQLKLGNALLRKGKVDEAAAHLQKALAVNPNDAGIHLNLGLCFFRLGRMNEAISQYQQALQIDPADPWVLNNLAWLLATCPEASLRNGSKAVELAQQANALTGGGNPAMLRTLAAACAAIGRFPEAVETAQRALELAAAQSDTGLSGQLQSEMKLYQAGRPFPGPAQTHQGAP